jgi:hypothetical protein
MQCNKLRIILESFSIGGMLLGLKKGALVAFVPLVNNNFCSTLISKTMHNVKRN